jgi:hypothetical protein
LRRKNNLPFFFNQIIFEKKFMVRWILLRICINCSAEMRRELVAFCLIFIFSPLFSSSQNRYDVLISECMPDPSPAVGLPETSFIELTNHSAFDYNLRNWKISNGGNAAIIKTDCLLKSDSFLILCPGSASESFRHFGSTMGISNFPSLTNDAGDIILYNDTGKVIHAIHYDRRWFHNELKADGGWSLEMIDLAAPAEGTGNWTASISPAGGTPGYKNSVAAGNPDDQAPSLLRAMVTDSFHLTLVFDEPLDPLTASDVLNYSVSGEIGSPASVISIPPYFDRVEMTLSKAMIPGKIYIVTVRQLCDVSFNEIGILNTAKAGIAEEVKTGDVIFNEILFNPPPFGFDYLELYNRSSKIISCFDLFLAGRDLSGSLKDPFRLLKETRVLFPGDYILVTENPDWVLKNYPLSDPMNIVTVSGMPSMPDDQGKLVLLNTSGETLDELDYDHHWHSPLLASESGVSLERIRPVLPTSKAANWTSAAADAGYGTPGYKNSESSLDSVSQGSDFIVVQPKIFSPDMDGYQDFCFIHYQLPDAGYTGSITIYDISGIMVRKLTNNTLWGTSGSFRWDGLDDEQNPLPMGHYIIYAEVFRTDGTVKKKKLVCVLARRR